MAKYVRFKKELQDKINTDMIYKVTNKIGNIFVIPCFGGVDKSFLEDVTILDVDLQRINNIVIGTLNYVEYDFKNEDRVFTLPESSYRERSLVLYKDKIALVRENNGFSDDIHFNSQQEAQDYVDKFSKIIDEINIKQMREL